MKNKKIMIAVLILMLAVGFATVTTTLVINATGTIGKNVDDFDVKFTKAIVDGAVDNTLISDNGHKITYTTKDLKNVGDKSTLNYEVTNNSKNYNAKIVLTCNFDGENNTYYSQSYKAPQVIKALATERGYVEISLEKVSIEERTDLYTCTLSVTAVERNTAGTESYSFSGILKDTNNNPISNRQLVMYSNEPHFVTTTADGYFFVGGLAAGSHEIYVMPKGTTYESISSEEKSTIIATAVDSLEIENISITTNETITFKQNKIKLYVTPIKTSNAITKWRIIDENGNKTPDVHEAISVKLKRNNEEPYEYKEEFFHVVKIENNKVYALKDENISTSKFGETSEYSSSIVKGILDNYASTLNNELYEGNNVISASLLTKDDMVSIYGCPSEENGKCNYTSNAKYINNKSNWWLSTTYSDVSLYRMEKGTIKHNKVTNEFGVRPLLEIPISDFGE